MFYRRRGRTFVFFILITLAPMARAAPQAPARTTTSATARHLALVGGMLLDGNEAPPIHHAAVLIEGNRTVQVGPASVVRIPADATRTFRRRSMPRFRTR
jgi:hypothetical protein